MRVQKLVNALEKQGAVNPEEAKLVASGARELKNTSRVARVMITNASSITEILKTQEDREDGRYDFDGKTNETPFVFDKIVLGTAQGANLQAGSALYKNNASEMNSAVRNCQLIVRQAGLIKLRENVAVLVPSVASDMPAGTVAYELPKAIAFNVDEPVDIQLKFPDGVTVTPSVAGELVAFEILLIGAEVVR